MCLVFDIETGPLPDEQLAEIFTFEAPPHPGEFDPATVKYGNLKDEAKRAAKLKECQDEHAAAVAGYATTVAEAREQAWADFKGRAALDPMTGQVLAIGIGRRIDDVTTKCVIISEETEAKTLAAFWGKFSQCRKEQTRLAGWNVYEFDLWFLAKRSYLYQAEVSIPDQIRDHTDRYWDRTFVDLMAKFNPGKHRMYEKLDAAAKYFRCGRKTEGINGGDFARLWFGTPEERKQATDYLRNDLKLTAEIAFRLGVI